MSRTATATADPATTYDELSQDEQDIHDRIASAGFKPVADGSRWTAECVQEGNDTRIGPFPDLAQLEEAINEYVNMSSPDDDRVLDAEVTFEDEGFELTPEAMGSEGKKVKVPRQALLPGTENAVLQDLRNAILSYRATTMEILDLQTRQKEENALVKGLMHKFEDELSVDRETGFKFYQVETIRAVLEIEEKEKLKTEKVDLP